VHPEPTTVIRFTRRLLAATLAAAAGLACAQSESRAPGPASADGPADAAQVLRSEGTTMLVRGASYSTPVRADVPIRSGDRIRTGTDGRVQLRFTDGALISIQPGSDFRVEAYAFDASRQRGFFELVRGSMRAVSGSIGKRDRDDWRLRTPTATIGIRGTEFTVDHAACTTACPAGVDPGLVVVVVAGRVAVATEAGSVEVPAGRTLRVRDAQTVPVLAQAPRPATTARGARTGARGEAGSEAGGPQRGPDGADGVPVRPSVPTDGEPAAGGAVGRR
jgi:hypothetical protein